MCDQPAEQQRDGLTGRQELATGTLRCRRGLPFEAKSLHSGEEKEYHVRVGVPKRKFWIEAQTMHQHWTDFIGLLQERGFQEDQIAMIPGGNFLSVMKEVLKD